MDRVHSYNSGRIQRADAIKDGASPRRHNYSGAPPSKKPKKKGKKALTIFLSVFLVLILTIGSGVWFAYDYFSKGLLDTGNFGDVAESFAAPDEWAGKVVNILFIGVDNDSERNEGDMLGRADMLLLVHWDFDAGKINMLQIPRDSYVGHDFDNSGDGRINAVLTYGPDKENPVNNLLSVFKKQYKIPVDKYVAMDMDGLKGFVDALNGLMVYVPQDMRYNGSFLEKGPRVLMGAEAEFFVRNRSGAGFERSDIDRAENQRYFYSALFRRLLTATPGDIVKLMPVFNKYFTTNFKLLDLVNLATKALGLDAANIMFCRVPGATSGEWAGTTGSSPTEHFVVDVEGRGTEEEPGLAQLLNTYFRTLDAPYLPEELGFPPQSYNIPDYVSLYDPGISSMGEVQGTEENVEDVIPS